MEHKENLLSGLFRSTSAYIELQSKSVKLSFFQKSTQSLVTAVQMLILAMLGMVTYLFLNIGMAFALSTRLGSMVAGFLITAGINLLFFVLYLFFRNRLGKKQMQNGILQGLSGSLRDYDALVAEQKVVEEELRIAGQDLRKSASEMKDRLSELEDQVNKLKAQLLSGNTSTEGGSFARTAVTTTIDILLNTFVLKNAGLIKRTLVPVITNAFVTSRLFKEKKKFSILENLKLKVGKFLK